MMRPDVVFNVREKSRWVVYLLAADNISGPLPSRLCSVNHPVIRPPCTVLGSTAKARVVVRMPRPSARPSARYASTQIIRSTDARLPWKIVPCVSRKSPLQWVPCNWLQCLHWDDPWRAEGGDFEWVFI